MSAKNIVVATHGHCFDGLASAAMFTHLRQQIGDDPLSFRYLSCGYSPRMQTIPERWLRGDENAIIDFRFTPTKRLHWYFDHHITAFSSDDERDAALQSSEQYFFDPSYDSCTKLVADVGEEHFGLDYSRFDELVQWAERLDSANFPSAEAALDRTRPAMQLAAVVEHHGDAALLQTLIPALLRDPLSTVGESEPVQQLWVPLAKLHEASRARITERATRQGDVVLVDLHDASLGSSGKFVAYTVAPDCTYSVALLRMRKHFKISIGYNPWCERPRRHDVAELCRKHGGGGHAEVGAISLPLDDPERAKTIAQSVVAALNG